MGRPKKTLGEVLRKDLESKRLDNQIAHNHASWQAAIRWQRLICVNVKYAFQNSYDDNEGRVPRGKPKKTWSDVLMRALEARDLDRQVAQNYALGNLPSGNYTIVDTCKYGACL